MGHDILRRLYAFLADPGDLGEQRSMPKLFQALSLAPPQMAIRGTLHELLLMEVPELWDSPESRQRPSWRTESSDRRRRWWTTGYPTQVEMPPLTTPLNPVAEWRSR